MQPYKRKLLMDQHRMVLKHINTMLNRTMYDRRSFVRKGKKE